MIFALLSFLFFIALEAFFALSEMALISADRLSLQKRAKKERIARIALKLLDNPERLFTTTIMVITMSIAGNAIFTSYFLISSLGNTGAIFFAFNPHLHLSLWSSLPQGHRQNILTNAGSDNCSHPLSIVFSFLPCLLSSIRA